MGLFHFLRTWTKPCLQNLPIFSPVEAFCAKNKIFSIMGCVSIIFVSLHLIIKIRNY